MGAAEGESTRRCAWRARRTSTGSRAKSLQMARRSEPLKAMHWVPGTLPRWLCTAVRYCNERNRAVWAVNLPQSSALGAALVSSVTHLMFTPHTATKSPSIVRHASPSPPAASAAVPNRRSPSPLLIVTSVDPYAVDGWCGNQLKRAGYLQGPDPISISPGTQPVRSSPLACPETYIHNQNSFHLKSTRRAMLRGRVGGRADSRKPHPSIGLKLTPSDCGGRPTPLLMRPDRARQQNTRTSEHTRRNEP